MKRLIVSAPESVTIESLTPEQQVALESVIAQWVQPMPGTIPFNGRVLIDTVMGDNFDPTAIGQLELPFEMVGYWEWNGSEVTTLVPADESLIGYLPNRVTYDEEGEPVNSLPPLKVLPHNWAGWPAVEL